MEILFSTEQTWTRADEIVDYLRGPRLWVPHQDYPDYDRWLEKVHRQIKSEVKRGILAMNRKEILGAVIYQRHPEISDVLEVRNISVRPDARGRHVASFLLKNAELEGAHDFGTTLTTVDAKARNQGIRAFLEQGGYSVLGARDLYSQNAGLDVVYTKGNTEPTFSCSSAPRGRGR